MINETKKTYYVLKLDGRPISGNFESPTLAEMEKSKLSAEDQKRVVVEQVTDSGQQVLFG